MVRETKILHTADTHLGYRQYHSEVRRNDFFKAFELVVNDAIEMQVEAVVHAGDLFDSRNPTLEDLLETMNILSKLKAAHIPFFGIVGNHENKQNTQWLDLLQEMGLALRLGKKPKLLGNVAIYGVDSVPRSKIPLFDYSDFEAPDPSMPENYRKLLVMHQIVQPFPYAEWDCTEIIENLPFNIDAILLGDYHKYEKFEVKGTWITYPGSTERNSASEREARSYNIITLSEDRLEISKRTIPTRNFSFISAKVNGKEKPYEQIFSAVNEHLEELSESVVFLEISGDSEAVLSFSELEEYLLNKGALVPKIRDQRIKEGLPEENLKVTFSDPERAVSEEIKRMNLNDGGLIVDEIVRSPNVLKTRVDEEAESRLLKLIEVINFKDPDFRIDNLTNPARRMEPENSSLNSEIRISENMEPELKTEFTGEGGFSESIASNSKVKSSEIIGHPKLRADSKILKPLGSIQRPEKKSFEKEINFWENSEEKSEKESENKIETFHEPEITQKTEYSLENKLEEKMEFSKDKKIENPDKTGKVPKKGQKREKEKAFTPRQYNLGDYL
ncbi:MAG TPA: exonuclease SbcCD subunit D [Methanosarcina sp.]|nr:exonuclease SbcCD subunit D [Methanosarcina sp.]